MHGDTDAAIEFLIAEGNISQDSDSSTDLISFEGHSLWPLFEVDKFHASKFWCLEE